MRDHTSVRHIALATLVVALAIAGVIFAQDQRTYGPSGITHAWRHLLETPNVPGTPLANSVYFYAKDTGRSRC